MGAHSPSIILPIRVKCGALQSFQRCCLKADIYKFSFSAQYGILHMSSIITIYVFRESKDLFPSNSLLLAFSPSLQNCQEMNFNLEELLLCHCEFAKLWINLKIYAYSQMGPENILKLRKFMLDFLSVVLSKQVLKSVQSPCLGTGFVSLSKPGHVCIARNSDVTDF